MFSIRLVSLLVFLITFGLLAHATPVSTDLAIRDSCTTCSNSGDVLALVTQLQTSVHANIDIISTLASPYMPRAIAHALYVT